MIRLAYHTSFPVLIVQTDKQFTASINFRWQKQVARHSSATILAAAHTLDRLRSQTIQALAAEERSRNVFKLATGPSANALTSLASSHLLPSQSCPACTFWISSSSAVILSSLSSLEKWP
ncbi:hypothetical protein [Nibricoccus aquaticus]|uniref:hypothetical protein n=1 Tax=Nibricoccus aquaticus TaxID=2576891 RepID=UPI0010FDFF23|nr:hypothetical protein [Nibricoccus aquaticus]